MTMGGTIAKPVRYFAYTLFAVLVTGLFLFSLFPSRAVGDYIARRFNQALPVFSISLSELRATLTGLGADRAKLAFSAFGRQPIFQAEDIRIKLRPKGLFKGQLWIEAAGVTGDGTIDGRLDHGGGRTGIRLRLHNGRFDAPVPVFGFTHLGVRKAELVMAVEDGIVRLSGCDIRFDRGAATLYGTVALERERPGQSRLDLRGSVAMAANGAGPGGSRVGVSITGSLARPKIRLSDANRL